MFDFLLETIKAINIGHVVMWAIGALLIFLAIKKDMEPALLLPIGFGTILVNIPFANVLTHGTEMGIIEWLFNGLIGSSASDIASSKASSAAPDITPLKELRLVDLNILNGFVLI